MAKQSGIHQIKGRVGQISYYRQSGVRDGLMRSINQGMSSRVKNNAEYANTRLNNSEFRNAAQVSQAAGQSIVPKYRPMFLTFSQARLTKSVLELIRQNSGDWGTRNLLTAQTEEFCAAISELAKRRFTDWIGDVVVSAGMSANTTKVAISISAGQSITLASLGIDGIDFKATGITFLAGTFNASLGRNWASTFLSGSPVTEDQELTGEENYFELDGIGLPVFTSPNYNALKAVVLIAMPYRMVNGKKYTLQEYCTFVAKPAVLPV